MKKNLHEKRLTRRKIYMKRNLHEERLTRRKIYMKRNLHEEIYEERFMKNSSYVLYD